MNLQTDRRELIAQAIHEQYRENQRDVKPPSDPAMQPWEGLIEELRESNRQMADNIATTLAVAGYAMRPMTGQAPNLTVFTPTEIEIMANMVHEQWVAERRQAGWLDGPKRDVIRKITPYLLSSYDNLPEEVKEWDRQVVRAIPAILASVGFEIYRIE